VDRLISITHEILPRFAEANSTNADEKWYQSVNARLKRTRDKVRRNKDKTSREQAPADSLAGWTLAFPSASSSSRSQAEARSQFRSYIRAHARSAALFETASGSRARRASGLLERKKKKKEERKYNRSLSRGHFIVLSTRARAKSARVEKGTF
jgi:hypothetical protein